MVDPEALALEQNVQAAVAKASALMCEGFHALAHAAVIATARSVFVDALERAEATQLTTRPQDLLEVVDFWMSKSRIGSRSEMIEESIRRRLIELNPAYEDRQTVAPDRLRAGARMLAAAATLTKIQSFELPDGRSSSSGTVLSAVLGDWTDQDRRALLTRPLFDPPAYGSVRFHHRSVREYLTAEWFMDLLSKGAPRASIEELFFHKQYGQHIITPSLRPMLPWVMLKDQGIRDRALRIAPELAFEGGDPVRLPVEVRVRVLKEVCVNLATGNKRQSANDHDAVQRFAHADIGEAVAELLETHADNRDVAFFLLRMVWIGSISQALRQAVTIAGQTDAEVSCRRMAIRALGLIGLPADVELLRRELAEEPAPLDRGVLAEFLDPLDPISVDLGWLLSCISKCERNHRYSPDLLEDKLLGIVRAVPLETLPGFLIGLVGLLGRPPLHEQLGNAVSVQFEWLLPVAADVLQRLLEARDPSCFDVAAFDCLRKIAVARSYGHSEVSETKADLGSAVTGWPDLNRAIFWDDVEQSRMQLSKKGERLTEWWRVFPPGALWAFVKSDFEYLIEEVKSRPGLDDRLVALSAAFTIFQQDGRPALLSDVLRNVAEGHSELNGRFDSLLNYHQTEDAKAFVREQKRYERRHARGEAVRQRNLDRSKADLHANLDRYRAEADGDPSSISAPIDYLFHYPRERGESGNRWSAYDWRGLIEPFGEDVARFYRDTAVRFWRHHTPQLRSEGAPMDKTTYWTIFGLTGLEIDALETADWLGTLSDQDVLVACRHASFELNGFPTWFPMLFRAFPNAVGQFLVQEIEFERARDATGEDLNYILSDVSWSGQWAWDYLGPRVLEWLREQEPQNVKVLSYLLKILQGSSIADEQLAVLAAEKCRVLSDSNHLGRWFAVWTGAEPQSAIATLKAHIETIGDADAQLNLSMVFVSRLFGGDRSEDCGTRLAFLRPQLLHSLYELVSQYVTLADDIDRAGTGVYSPGLRDWAQEGRNKLYQTLLGMPGKEAFVAAAEIARNSPDRPWFERLAYEKAEADGDIDAFTAGQVREFHDVHERTPKNHRELAELATSRLRDLKSDLEDADESIAGVLLKIDQETEMRNWLARELKQKAQGRYSIHQEEERADATRTDIRFQGSGFDAPVPIELKLAQKWTGPKLFERLENQLCRDYLRDARSRHGIFLLVKNGAQQIWEMPEGMGQVDFEELVLALQAHWEALSPSYAAIDNVTVVGIDLTTRGAGAVRNRRSGSAAIARGAER